MNELLVKYGWLTQVECADDVRGFFKKVVGVHATYEYWKEVSNEWKEQWEQEHPVPKPEETTKQL